MSSPTDTSEGDGAGMYHAELARVNNELAVLARENRRRTRELEQVKAQLERTVHELETSYWRMRKLQEVLPICLGCSQVHGDQGWQPLLEFLRKEAPFLSHSYCPDCLQRELSQAAQRDSSDDE